MAKNSGLSRGLIFILSIITLFTTVSPVAGLMTEITVEDLTREADVIAIGNVEEVNSRWSLTGATVYTYTTLSVEEYIKGNEGQGTLTIITEGGCALGFCVWVEDTPTFTKNEAVLVFLKKTGKEYSVPGWAQGKYIIENGGVRSEWDNKTEPLVEFRKRIQDSIPLQEITIPATTKGAPGFEALIGLLGLLAVRRMF